MPSGFLVPLPWRTVRYSCLLIAAPTLWTIAEPACLDRSPFYPGLLTLVWGSLALILWIVRSLTIDAAAADRQARRSMRRTAVLRLLAILLVSACWLTFVAKGWALRAIFTLHRPWFEAARRHVLSTPPPLGVETYPAIGLFNVEMVVRGPHGEIAFVLNHGASICYDPNSAGRFVALYPPGDSGRLGAGWRWRTSR